MYSHLLQPVHWDETKPGELYSDAGAEEGDTVR